ncbi:MAG: AbrB/MazE/SpoVT family DNA-binding domain-containing protein [Methylibium sp.]|nr:AbrB/MazE/SpoVT family DNA-binding domain-containing protein [Methylibium sp.]
MPPVIIRVLMDGQHQTVRIPPEFRLDANRVEISRDEQGGLVLRPVEMDRGAAFLQALDSFDDELGTAFAEALDQSRRTPTADQEREDPSGTCSTAAC